MTGVYGTPDDFLPTMEEILKEFMRRELAGGWSERGSSPVRFSAKRTWERVDRDLDEVFLSMIGIKP